MAEKIRVFFVPQNEVVARHSDELREELREIDRQSDLTPFLDVPVAGAAFMLNTKTGVMEITDLTANLGLATTAQLLEELEARLTVDGDKPCLAKVGIIKDMLTPRQLAYRTVGSE